MTPRLARVTMILSAAVLAATLVANAQSKDPFVGTWKLNAAKSKYSPGPTPKSITSIYEAAGQGYKVSVTNESPSGKTQYGYTTNLDGKDSTADGEQSERRHDRGQADRPATRWRSVSKKGGKVTTSRSGTSSRPMARRVP